MTDGAGTTELEQTIHNQGRTPAEAVWILPLPPGATADGFRIAIDGQESSGEVLPAAQARAHYEATVRRARDPGLLEYAGRGCLRARVFPVPAQGSAQVKVRWREVLPVQGGMLHYSFPLRAAQVDALRPERVALEVRIRARGPIRNVWSPLALADVVIKDEHEARVSVELGPGQIPERDLSVFCGQADQDFGLHLLTYRKGDQPGFFLAMLAPKRDWQQAEQRPKLVQLVLDTSGSMAGAKMEQAKAAMRFFVQALTPRDQFNLIPFSTEAQPFFAAPVDADSAHVKDALASIERLQAGGGTNFEHALRTTLDIPPPDSRVPITVLVTDGQPTVGNTDEGALLKLLAESNRGQQRLFVLGVGNDVNTRLLDRIAGDSRGLRDYVAEGEDLEVKTSDLFTRLSRPVMSDCELHVDGVKVVELAPQRLPDLFDGSRVVVLGRYHGGGLAQLRLRGQVGATVREYTYQAEFAAQSTEHDFVRTLWAERRAAILLDAQRLHGASPELTAEIERLGREFGVVTELTSAFAPEPSARVAQGGSPGRQTPRGPTTPGPSRRTNHGGSYRGTGGSVGASRELAARAGSDEFFLGGSKRSQATGAQAGPRRVKERVFDLHDGVWVDRAVPADWQKVAEKIAAFSPEYFALLEDAPELAPCFALGPRVRLVVGTRVLEIIEAG